MNFVERSWFTCEWNGIYSFHSVDSVHVTWANFISCIKYCYIVFKTISVSETKQQQKLRLKLIDVRRACSSVVVSYNLDNKYKKK